jgi:prepilin-type N-terminal cleavage/methylation domain-containing protein
MRKKYLMERGFTLVELLIVIALISILSVAVLATINPIEQANKAKDSTVQNDAAEVMNAYERYYVNGTSYPWMDFTEGAGAAITKDDAVLYRSDQAGFGICYAATSGSSTAAGTCNTSGANLGRLIENDELKPTFAGKGEFVDPGDNNENSLYLYKYASSGGGVYVCYIPKAKSNRQLGDKLYCLYNSVATWGATGTKELVKTGETSTGGDCAALPVGDAGWSTPAFDGVSGMFRCVPE